MLFKYASGPNSHSVTTGISGSSIHLTRDAYRAWSQEGIRDAMQEHCNNSTRP
jgi:hypothetical protein